VSELFSAIRFEYLNEERRGMLEKGREILSLRRSFRRRRTLNKIRREFEKLGYAFNDVTDSELEAAITFAGNSVEDFLPLTGKTMYWMLRRISQNGAPLRKPSRL
jgi:hypothetical protein